MSQTLGARTSRPQLFFDLHEFEEIAGGGPALPVTWLVFIFKGKC